MADFLSQSQSEGLPPLVDRRGTTSGDEWLYYAYRCAFVHGIPREGILWGWNRRSTNYWFRKNGLVGLNVDELVRGFNRGVGTFRQLLTSDSDLKQNFAKYLRAH
jgi:hypothetical protein